METIPQLLVKFKGGEHAVFDLSGYEEYLVVGQQLRSRWGKFIYLNKNALVRKDEIERLFYLPEGYGKKPAQVSNEISIVTGE